MKLKLTLWLCLIAGSILAADKPISGLTVFTGTPGTNDLFPFVNRADLTQSTNGSTRSITWSNLNYWLNPGFNGQQFSQIGQTNVYIKSGSDQTNVLLYPSLSGNPSAVFYDSSNVQKASFNYQGGFDSSGNNTFTGTNNFTGTSLFPRGTITFSGLQSIMFTNGVTLTNIHSNNDDTWTPTYTLTNQNVVFLNMPPLRSPNSRLFYSYGLTRSSTQYSTLVRLYAGQSTNNTGSITNWLIENQVFSGSAVRASASLLGIATLYGSYSSLNQDGGSIVSTSSNLTWTSVNFSLPWVLALQVADGSPSTVYTTNSVTLKWLSIGEFIP